jgi:hypothetical protein
LRLLSTQAFLRGLKNAGLLLLTGQHTGWGDRGAEATGAAGGDEGQLIQDPRPLTTPSCNSRRWVVTKRGGGTVLLAAEVGVRTGS